jgi:hypothetical protein
MSSKKRLAATAATVAVAWFVSGFLASLFLSKLIDPKDIPLLRPIKEPPVA